MLDDIICRERDWSIILCGMWSLWNSRNDRKHGKSPIPMKLAIDWALDVCLQLTIDTDRHMQNQSPRVAEWWQKPGTEFVKINTDGAFQMESLSGAMGTVIRDVRGSYLKASARPIPSVGSALMGEAEAWRDGIRLLGPLEHHKVTLETDSLELVNLWPDRKTHRSEVHPILQDIQALISGFSSFLVHHTKGSANIAAHCVQGMLPIIKL
jgi:ribonuclease HI